MHARIASCEDNSIQYVLKLPALQSAAHYRSTGVVCRLVVGSLWELLPIPRSAALCQGGWTLLRPHLGSPASCPVKGRDREAGVSTTCLFSSVPLGYHGSSPCPMATVPLPSVHSSCHRCYWLPWLLLVLQTQETTDPFLPCLQPERHTP